VHPRPCAAAAPHHVPATRLPFRRSFMRRPRWRPRSDYIHRFVHRSHWSTPRVVHRSFWSAPRGALFPLVRPEECTAPIGPPRVVHRSHWSAPRGAPLPLVRIGKSTVPIGPPQVVHRSHWCTASIGPCGVGNPAIYGDMCTHTHIRMGPYHVALNPTTQKPKP
jgi:hypothetical protein